MAKSRRLIAGVEEVIERVSLYARRNARGQYGSLVAIVALTAAVRLAGLHAHSLWYDEGWSLRLTSAASLGDVVRQVVRHDGSERYQPLYFAMLYLWRSVFGEGEGAVRLLSVLLGALAVPVAYFAARRLFGPSVALLTGGLMAASAYGVYYSQEVRPYALILLLTALQLNLFARYLVAADRGKSAAAFAVITLVALLSSIFVALYTAALSVAHLITLRKDVRWLPLWVLTAVVASPAAAYFAWAAAVAPHEAGVSTASQSLVLNAIFVLYGLLVGTTYGPPVQELRGTARTAAVMTHAPSLALLVIAVAILFWLFVHWMRASVGTVPDRKRGAFFGVTLVVTFLLSVVLSQVTHLNWLPRHGAVLAVPLVVLIAVTLASARGRAMRACAAAAGIILAGANVYSGSQYFFGTAHRRDDYRGVAHYLMCARQWNDTSVLLWGIPDLLAYYGDTETVDGTHIAVADLGARLNRIAAPGGAVYIVMNRGFYWHNNASVAAAVAPQFVVHDTVRFSYFDVYLARARADHSRPPTVPRPEGRAARCSQALDAGATHFSALWNAVVVVYHLDRSHA